MQTFLIAWLVCAIAMMSSVRTVFVKTSSPRSGLIWIYFWFPTACLTDAIVIYYLPCSAGIMSWILLLVSFTLFAWSAIFARKFRLTLAFSPDVPAVLLHHGPYRILRHPFYTSYIGLFISATAACRSLLTAAVAGTVIVTYSIAARTEELKFRQSHLGSAYDEYRTRVGLRAVISRWKASKP